MKITIKIVWLLKQMRMCLYLATFMYMREVLLCAHVGVVGFSLVRAFVCLPVCAYICAIAGLY